ncbi:hypothetical protein FHS83_003470 [Rhizomicrobium palustre]|uniref:Uncharacterized protein n=1 Tax=Rhizomicrobium palustre TaxID=189966 RepID=A0A846N4N5_9PROT|nr:hypothetical protein [Rhizomicrobium palustre]NIK90152.1 hypothetical protein [Rhizomicrobium palustre]
MASWVRCIEYEVGIDPSISPQLLINLDVVQFMVRGTECTRVVFGAGESSSAIEVHETPEQILGVAPK